MKKSIKRNVLKAIGKIAEFEANVVATDWSPICAGLIHQPKRPKKQKPIC